MSVLRIAPALISLVVTPIWAEEVAIKGRVVDETNAPVAGVHVRFSPHGTPETISSDAAGGFEVTLPSFGRYVVEAVRESFYTLKDHPIEVRDQHELVIVLNHQQEQFESVKVTETKPEVDLDKNYTEESLSGSQILNMPVPDDRYLRKSFRLMPNVVQDSSGGVHFAGGAENQVLYTLDGFNIGDPVTGAFDVRVSPDAVRSVEFTSGSVSPESGRGSAGSVSIHTKMGDDRFRYIATNFIPGVDERKGLRMGAFSPRFGISGPLHHGRVWYTDNTDVQYLPLVVQDLPKGQDTAITLQGSNLARIQANLSPGNNLYASMLANYLTTSNSGLGPLDPTPTTTDRRARSWFFSLKDQIYLGHGALLEIGYGEKQTLARQIPQGDEIYQLTPLGRRGNYFVNSTQASSRKQLLSSLTLPLNLWGKHQITGGIDLDAVDYRQDVHRTAYEQFNGAGALLWVVTFNGPSHLQVNNSEAAWYLTDGWAPHKNVRIDYGVRQDWDRLSGRWAMAPRASVSYAPWVHTRLSVGYTVSHDETSLQLFSRPFDQRPVTTFYSATGTPTGPPTLGAAYIAPRGQLGNGAYHTWTSGVDRRLPHNLQLTTTLMRKRGADGLTYVSNHGTFELVRFKRDIYDSAVFAVHQAMDSVHEWSVSYTRSGTLSNAVVDVNADQTRIVKNNYGRMGWDVPDRLMSFGYLPTPLKRWSVAYLLETHEGSPFSIDRDGAVVGAVNSSRFPTYFELDLHLECKLTLIRKRVAIRAGFNNVTDHFNPTVVNSSSGSPNFLKFYGNDGRHLVIRLRTLGKE